MIGLWGGAEWIVTSATKIAKKFGVSELIIGLTIVAVATSAPEFAVTISAAIKGEDSISVGNVIGSNIFNLGTILGFIAFLTPLKISKTLLKREGFLLLGTGFLLVIFFYDLYLSFIEGILLVSTLIIYIIVLIKQRKDIDGLEEEIPEGELTFWDIPKFIFGVAIIIFSANVLVESASNIARFFGVSDWLIGITIVAAGTSMPEFATSVVALKKKQHGISAGNLIGSDLFNMLGVLGVATIIEPLQLVQEEYLSLILLAVTLIILIIVMRTGWKISKWEGALLFCIAIFRWGYDFIF
ncbi:MAG: conjugal transfer protein TraR [Ignavibacteriae bacterium]|nr:MAG: conjugal transfer protein TraR [Ignavibacteriota bacterium]